jgi:ABC-type lipoprotein export system ATPase subunit
MHDPSGSQWRKWDLHVHTPSSLFHKYTGDAAWERFLNDLEALPPEFKVIGVNDYIFLDGYKKLKTEKDKGRLGNIALLLPVIELRLDKFGGSLSHLSKVNFHIIFSEEIDANLIEKQFLNGLWTRYDLTPSYAELKKTWKAVPTKESIEELGNLIIASVPPEKRTEFGSPLMEGFANLTFSKEVIIEALNKPYFKGKYLFAVGKAEWANIKWNDNSIADKKNTVNGVDLVFTAAASPEDCEKSRAKLKEENVNHHLLDCSDAHSFAGTTEKDRIGNCFTWIKSDTTFAGLRHALLEFDDRIFVGEEPPKLREVRQNRTHYISSVEFRKAAGSKLDEFWFDGQVPINHGLVAIIGNKGSGKSALADTIGLVGNCQQHKSFSFLSETRFRDPKENKAKYFEAALTWESGQGKFKNLDANVGAQDVESVKYIPQNFLEQICNETENKQETDFDRELKQVIFSHVRTDDRLGQDSLDSLLLYKTGESYELIKVLRVELEKINAAISDCEDRLAPDYKKQIENSLQTKLDELVAHEGIKPIQIEPPAADATVAAETATLISTINTKKDSRKALSEDIQKAGVQRSEDNRLISVADRALTRIGNFRRSFESFKKEASVDLAALGLTFESVVQLTINTPPLDEKRAALVTSRSGLDSLLDPLVKDSLSEKLTGVDKEIADLQLKLDKPGQLYQTYLGELEEWNQKQLAISGDEWTPGTVIYLKNLLDQIALVPAQEEALTQARRDKTHEIFDRISALGDTYRELYGAVKDFISDHPVAKDQLQLNFEVSVEDTGFENRFFDQVSRGVVGSFMGVEEGQKVLRNILKKYNFNEWDQVRLFTEEIIDNLHYDRRGGGSPLRVGELLRKGYTVPALYDYIFSLVYLQPRYTLKLGDKELSQLSPGEKGALLLIFYLLVDRGQIPLVIDQPEENLDNQTMFKLLVPCLRDAKKKRQVIIVTHNPNLAVVSDAEQVIHAGLDKANKNKMTYTSGALENTQINKKVLDVLEGTRPAFNNRAQKYHEETD